jgi:hypothetical protein
MTPRKRQASAGGHSWHFTGSRHARARPPGPRPGGPGAAGPGVRVTFSDSSESGRVLAAPCQWHHDGQPPPGSESPASRKPIPVRSGCARLAAGLGPEGGHLESSGGPGPACQCGPAQAAPAAGPARARARARTHRPPAGRHGSSRPSLSGPARRGVSSRAGRRPW